MITRVSSVFFIITHARGKRPAGSIPQPSTKSITVRFWLKEETAYKDPCVVPKDDSAADSVTVEQPLQGRQHGWKLGVIFRGHVGSGKRSAPNAVKVEDLSVGKRSRREASGAEKALQPSVRFHGLVLDVGVVGAELAEELFISAQERRVFAAVIPKERNAGQWIAAKDATEFEVGAVHVEPVKRLTGRDPVHAASGERRLFSRPIHADETSMSTQ